MSTGLDCASKFCPAGNQWPAARNKDWMPWILLTEIKQGWQHLYEAKQKIMNLHMERVIEQMFSGNKKVNEGKMINYIFITFVAWQKELQAKQITYWMLIDTDNFPLNFQLSWIAAEKFTFPLISFVRNDKDKPYRLKRVFSTVL